MLDGLRSAILLTRGEGGTSSGEVDNGWVDTTCNDKTGGFLSLLPTGVFRISSAPLCGHIAFGWRLTGGTGVE